jgi:hypothetical protein
MSISGSAWHQPRVEFWSRSLVWPMDSSEYVFLARAFHEIGRAAYAGQWTGEEPLAVYDIPLPDSYNSSLDDQTHRRAVELIFRTSESYRLRTQSLYYLPEPTPEEWAGAKRLYDEMFEQSLPPFRRFDAIVRLMVALLEAGHLDSGWRLEHGGEILPIARGLWNSEASLQRFQCCQFLIECPFREGRVVCNGQWLFISRRSLHDCLAFLSAPTNTQVAQAPEIPGASWAEHASVYVRFMVELSAKLKLSPETEPTVEALKAHIEEAWPGRGPELSGKLLSAMATLMRSPESQKGKARGRSPHVHTTDGRR